MKNIRKMRVTPQVHSSRVQTCLGAPFLEDSVVFANQVCLPLRSLPCIPIITMLTISQALYNEPGKPRLGQGFRVKDMKIERFENGEVPCRGLGRAKYQFH